MNEPLEAVVFDMDGVLVDSEPLWRRAEVRIFRSVGLALEEADCFATQGLRVDEVVKFWRARNDWGVPDDRVVADRIIEAVIQEISHSARALPGVHDALACCRAMGLALGLASSSSLAIIQAVLARLDLESAFSIIASAESETFGKPHPAVYLTTLRQLGVGATRSVAIEDSIPGVIAAKAARMRCVAVPEAEMRNDQRFGIADVRLDSLNALDASVLSAL